MTDRIRRDQSGHRWRTVRAYMLKNGGDLCPDCGIYLDRDLPAGDPRAVVVHHVVPVSRGGDRYAVDNLRLTCAAFNMRKGDRMPTAHLDPDPDRVCRGHGRRCDGWHSRPW